MRPLRLTIEGFTCFSDKQEIDFSGMEVFVISGATGAGKTSIVDAICYALYGEMPRSEGAVTVLSHNRDTMQVDLEFTARGKRYRVSRQLNTTRKTRRDGSNQVTRNISPAQLAEWDDRRGEFRGIDDRRGSIDARITDIVGLDFDAFTRCVVLPQGRFQEFLAGDRAKRRGVLTDLLDIGIYTKIMQAANTRASVEGGNADQARKHLEEAYTDATVENLEQYRVELAGAHSEVALRTGEHEVLVHGERIASDVAQHIGRRKNAEDRVAGAEKEIEKAEALREGGAAEIARLDVAEKEYEAAIVAIGFDAELHSLLGQLVATATERTRAQKAYADAQSTLGDRKALEASSKRQTSADANLAKADAALRAAREAREHLQRQHAAASLRSGLKPGDPCPVCGEPIKKLRAAPEASVASAERALKDAEANLETARQEHQAAGREAASVEAAVEQAQRRSIEAAAALAEVEERLSSMLPDGLTADEQALRAAQASQAEARTQYVRISAELKTTIDRRRELDQRLANVHSELAVHEAELKAAEHDRVESAEAVRLGLQSLREAAAQNGWAEVTALLDVRQNPLDTIRQAVADANHAVIRASQQVTSLEGMIARIERDIETAARLREDESRYRAASELYREFGSLLRADQLQEYILGEAMRVLAGTASLHLQALHPRFSLEVKGSEFEIIDNWQGDQRRSARTLSGGETFIVSLALSLALAESLPTIRANIAASLESLFIDEGFGTLDPATLDIVITALEGLRAQERMVGIITHVPELAQRIESRIEVTGDAAGSRLTVVGA